MTRFTITARIERLCARARLACAAALLTAGNDAGMLNGQPSSTVPDVPVTAAMGCVPGVK